MNLGLFTNEWIAWVFNTYSIAIIAFPSIIIFLLKVIAIYNPNIKSDKIIELIKEFWPKKENVIPKEK